jgi:hypothetical protein
MANMELITSVTVGSGGVASVTLPATGTIPATYTDLKVVVSSRSARGGGQVSDGVAIQFNGSTSNLSMRYLDGNGSSAGSSTDTAIWTRTSASGATASTFGNAEFYIPNYTSSSFKSVSVDGVSENNATSAFAMLSAGLWSNTAAITSIRLVSINAENFVEGSTFYLYGISNVTSTTKATGGIVSSDGTYNYHMFPFSGTFTPTTAISADVLCIAGGGGGGGERTGAGAGAGGLLYFSSQSLTATGYTVTVGAGGAGGNAVLGTVGADSQFGALTLVKGGGLGGAGADAGSGFNGGNGGSGGGGGGWGANGTAGSPTSGQGNSGSAGQGAPNYPSGAGGGAGAAGQTITGSSTKCADGGIGTNTYSSFAIATQTGVNGYYAGGGGGGGNPIPIPNGIGGLGGGGDGGANTFDGNRGLTNTGGGGGGSGKWTSGVGGNGGSGLVIIRYAI